MGLSGLEIFHHLPFMTARGLLSSLSLVACIVLLCGLSAAGQIHPPFSVQVTGSGPPMILIPGLTCGGDVWDGTVEHFKRRYQCHVVTIAGFAGQPASEGPMLEKVRDGLAGYIRERKLTRPVVIGHSLGGFLSFWLGATMPGEVGSIIVVDGVPYFPALQNPKATPKAIEPFAKALKSGMASQTHDQFAAANRLFLAGMIIDPKELEKVAEQSSRSDPKASAQALYELMTIDVRDQVKNITSPVLLLGASASIADPVARKAAEENYRREVATIPQCKVVFAPKARHFIQLDEPEFFFGQVETFLKDAN
jgi:pimeloyl-ACP methyl ester carboxylesterase